jgi:hypothetical protein
MIELPIIETSFALAAKLASVLEVPLHNDSARTRASFVMCSVALEHSQAVRLLVADGLFTSAVAIHRSQYEALVRAAWIFYAATDQHVNLFASELTRESAQGAKNLPQVSDMMKALDGKAPSGAYQALSNFKTESWAALNSYVHAGIHALNRHGNGYPRQLVEQVVKNANALSIAAGMQAAVLTGRQELVHAVGQLQFTFSRCLPDLPSAPA